MALINITNVEVKNSISQFTDPIVLDITFECLAEIKSDITWKLIYIGKANDCSYDQVLEEIIMGPLTTGTMNFSFEATSPDWTKIPSDELLRITAIILQVHYRDQEFFRLGYYVYNQVIEQNNNSEEDFDSKSKPVDITKVQRNILADKPRITRLPIEWIIEQNKEKVSQQSTQELGEEQQHDSCSISLI